MPVIEFVESKDQLDALMNVDHVIGKNLAIGSSSEWSDWITPELNIKNSCFTPSYAILPSGMKDGDYYTWSFEIEFKDVTAADVNSEDQEF